MLEQLGEKTEGILHHVIEKKLRFNFFIQYTDR